MVSIVTFSFLQLQNPLGILCVYSGDWFARRIFSSCYSIFRFRSPLWLRLKEVISLIFDLLFDVSSSCGWEWEMFLCTWLSSPYPKFQECNVLGTIALLVYLWHQYIFLPLCKGRGHFPSPSLITPVPFFWLQHAFTSALIMTMFLAFSSPFTN